MPRVSDPNPELPLDPGSVVQGCSGEAFQLVGNVGADGEGLGEVAGAVALASSDARTQLSGGRPASWLRLRAASGDGAASRARR
jgi:hypothetical protein